jgi:hypothetical protein
LGRRGEAPPPHAAPLSKAHISLNIYSDIEILIPESILNKILKSNIECDIEILLVVGQFANR